MEVPRKTKTELPYDSEIPFLGIYMETAILGKESCSLIFTATLLAIARTWEQPKCPLTEEWIKNTWHRYTVE